MSERTPNAHPQQNYNRVPIRINNGHLGFCCSETPTHGQSSDDIYHLFLRCSDGCKSRWLHLHWRAPLKWYFPRCSTSNHLLGVLDNSQSSCPSFLTKLYHGQVRLVGRTTYLPVIQYVHLYHHGLSYSGRG